MKKQIFFVGIVAMIMGCSSEELPIKEAIRAERQANNPFAVKPEEALKKAELFFFELEGTRSSYPMKIKAISNNARTRSEGNETVAYVINRGEDEGFVIMSADSRVLPVLAYSDTGFFDETNTSNSSYAGFVDLLPDFCEAMIELYDEENAEEISSFPLASFEASPKLAPPCWGQHNPFNKYAPVVSTYQDWTEAPEAQAVSGCVPLSAVQLAMNCLDTVTYNGHLYHCRDILVALRDSVTSPNLPWNPTIVPPFNSGLNSLPGSGNSGSVFLYGTYDWAIDEVAQCLRAFGDAINAKWHVDVTWAGMDSALAELSSGFNLQPVATGTTFLLRTAIRLIDDMDCILWVDGRGNVYVNGAISSNYRNGRHAWLIDGCRYALRDRDGFDVFSMTAFFHCDWGDDGNNNGWFNGGVWRQEFYQGRWNEYNVPTFNFKAFSVFSE